MKRTLFCFLFSLNTFFASSATFYSNGFFQVNGFNYYKLGRDSVAFVGSDSSFLKMNHINSITIPSKITYSNTCYQVVAIIFINSEKYPTVTDISIPSSIVGFLRDDFNRAFAIYPNLKAINVSSNNKNLQSIDGVLFDKKGKILFKYPPQINVASYSVPISVKYIAYNAFDNCKELQNINIPASVKQIGSDNFEACNKLQKITVDDENLKYSSINRVLYNKKKTVLIRYPVGRTDSTFKVPASVKTIASNAFTNNYSLRHIELSSSLDTIQGYAFENCKNLKDITLPSSISTVGANAFASCTSLTRVVISSSKTKYYSEVFANCNSLKTVVFPPDQTAISDEMFRNCTGLCDLTLPVSLRSIGENAFNGCTGLKELILPVNITEIGADAFRNCTGLKKILLPVSLTTINSEAFTGCTGISELTLPATIKYIRERAFWGCTNLKSVTIPSSILLIGNDAFRDCTNLMDIQYPDTHITLGQHVFDNTAYLNSQPDGIVYLNKMAYTIKGKSNMQLIDLNEETTGIADYAFCNQACYDLKIHNTVRYIGANAFENCKNLAKNISLPLSLTYIGDKAFYNCSGFPSITIPSSVKYIGNEAFRDSYNLNVTQIPDSLDFIGMFAFSNTEWYSTKPDGLIYIGSKLYRYKESKQKKDSIEIKTGTTAIVGGAFSGRDNMKVISIPATVTEIGDKAFENCTGLKSITLPQSVTSIGDHAFLGCSGLSSIYTLSFKPIKFSCRKYTFTTPSISVEGYLDRDGKYKEKTELKTEILCDEYDPLMYEVERAIAYGNGRYAFDGINKDSCTLYVPVGSKKLYEQADYWKDFKKIVEFNAATRK